MPRASEATPWVKARSLVTPCKGRSINPCVDFAQSLCHIYYAFALTGRQYYGNPQPQGVASLALGYVLHWAFSPPLQNQLLGISHFLELFYLQHQKGDGKHRG